MIALLIASASGASVVITDSSIACELMAMHLRLFAVVLCIPAGVLA
ncbi:hypothetical protein [Roseicitreum antarcticum]|nr:hypothetical protein [Roseicitreum antarcticum]